AAARWSGDHRGSEARSPRQIRLLLQSTCTHWDDKRPMRGAQQVANRLTRRDQMRASRIIGSIPVAITAAILGFGVPARANVITDWDEKAISLLRSLPNYPAERIMGMVHCAMFDAVNSIERRYRPYLVQLAAEATASKEAAAAAAAATVLASIDQKTADETKAALAAYLAGIPDAAAKLEGIRLGEAVAAKVLAARANDGADAPDAYRPKTSPGVYVATAMLAASTWPNVKP